MARSWASVAALAFLVACSPEKKDPPRTLARVEVTPPAPAVPAGATVQLHATAVYSDQTTEDVTVQAAWTSASPGVASVSDLPADRGLVLAATAGTARVTATFGGLSGFADVTVRTLTVVGIDVTPAAPSLPKGEDLQLTATARYDDDTTYDVTASAAWTSAAAAVASVSDVAGTKGRVHGVAEGAAGITATFGGVSGEATVTVTPATLVSVRVEPLAPDLAIGAAVALHAYAVLGDGTELDVTQAAEWSILPAGVVSVSMTGTRGVVTAIAQGTASVTAAYGGRTGTASVTVRPALLESIDLTPPAPATVVGGTVELRATGHYEDGTSRDVTAQATWSSAGVATVSNATGDKGTVTAHAVGTATITAAIGSVQQSVTVTVQAFTAASLRVDPDLVLVAPGRTARVRVYARATSGAELDVTALATYRTSSAAVATVSGATVTGVAPGTATVTATYGQLSRTANVIVEVPRLEGLRLETPPLVNLGVGAAGQVWAVGLYSDMSERDVTDLATWASTAPGVVAVSDAGDTKGEVEARAPGTATVTASYGGLSATTAFSVAARSVLWVMMEDPQAPLPVGATHALRALAVYDDFETEDVTGAAVFASSSAAVEVTGAVATTRAAGSAVVSAEYGGFVGRTLFTVVGDAPSGLSVSLGQPAVYVGSGTWLDIDLHYANGTTWDVSDAAAVTSSDAAVAIIARDDLEGDRWVVAVAPGTARIDAAYAGVVGTATLTVNANATTAFSLDAPAVVPQGGTARAWVVAAYPSTAQLTDVAEWTSSNPAVLEVSNAGWSKGTLYGIAPGTATVTATYGGNTATAVVEVRGGVIALDVTPSQAEVRQYSTGPFRAIATLAGGATLDVTEWATWSVEGEAASLLMGTILGDTPGTAIVTASYGGSTGHALMTVVGSGPISVTILPRFSSTSSTLRLPRGMTVKLAVVAEYGGDEARYPVDGVTWTSDVPFYAAFSTDPAHAGELTAIAKGTAAIHAEYDGVLSSAVYVVVDDPRGVAAAPSLTTTVGGYASLPLNVAFPNGTSTVTGNLSPFVTWTSSAPAVAIAQGGYVFGLTAGVATLEATVAGFPPVQTVVTVSTPGISSLQVWAESPAVGARVPLTLDATLANGDHVSVAELATFGVTPAGIVELSGVELVGLAPGSATITGAYAGRTSTGYVNVGGSVGQLTIWPVSTVAPVGALVCPYVYSPSTYRSMGARAAFEVSDPAVVAMTKVDGEPCVRALANGSAVVTARYGSASVSMVVTVQPVRVPPDVARLWWEPDRPIRLHERVRFEAWVPTEANVTDAATWTSADPSIVKAAAPGRLEGVAPGRTTVTVRHGGLSTVAPVAVHPAAVVSVEASRWAAAVPVGAPYALRLSATYSDGVGDVDVTAGATWSVDDATIVELDPAVPGGLRAKAPGVTFVEATVGAFTAQVPVTVF